MDTGFPVRYGRILRSSGIFSILLVGTFGQKKKEQRSIEARIEFHAYTS
jgi:hypothetical protein